MSVMKYDEKYFKLLSEKYPDERSLAREIINLTAILNLPKGTEHFMSDIHGEYEAFCHILNNCSGVIREKVDMLYRGKLTHSERKDICTLIYYTEEKLALDRRSGLNTDSRYCEQIVIMIEIARVLSSKYTRSKVRKAMPSDYAYIIDELLHAQKDEDDNQVLYHNIILDTIVKTDADGFIIALAGLIKRLAVDRLHIVGDIFDRGESADKIIDLLTTYHNLDIEWGNHDILYMGAACGSEACIANVVRNSIKYRTVSTLENGYGISLRSLALFSEKLYPGESPMRAALKAITLIQFKLEGQLIMRNPSFNMDDRLLLDKIDPENGTIEYDGEIYKLKENRFPTLDRNDPYGLSDDEREVISELKAAFTGSERLKRHIAFIYERGSIYRVYNGNLLYHGCVPLNSNGSLSGLSLFGESLSGRAYFDKAEKIARHAFFGKHKRTEELDFMWYLWSGRKSPLCGRNIKTFERAYIADASVYDEEQDPYYSFCQNRDTCELILREFGLDGDYSHIINGHTPVKTTRGELPIRAGGKLLVIDGGFCRDYHEKTGIAGYTLIYNSHGLRLKAHEPFESVTKALKENIDIHSDSEIVETEPRRVMVGDTDDGDRIKSEIADLKTLLDIYRGEGQRG